MVHDEGKAILEDGAEARVVKVALPEADSKKEPDNYWLFTIRSGNNTIEKMEWVAQGKPLLVIRRGKAEPGQAPSMGWDLAGVAKQVAGTAAAPGPGIRADMVIPGVSVQHMIEKADVTTYVFSKDPPWAGNRQIVDILDIANPPHRMFMIAYRAKDGRHVVLVQSLGFNTMVGPVAKKECKVIYTSPGGVKVWSGPRDQWGAQIALQSARAWIVDPPGKELTGLFLETPAETFLALAVNGKLSEEELHALVDSLVPAKDEAAKTP